MHMPYFHRPGYILINWKNILTSDLLLANLLQEFLMTMFDFIGGV